MPVAELPDTWQEPRKPLLLHLAVASLCRRVAVGTRADGLGWAGAGGGPPAGQPLFLPVTSRLA